MGLSPDFHILTAKEIKAFANEIAQGRIIIVLCGGSRRDLAREVIPRMIRVLMEDG